MANTIRALKRFQKAVQLHVADKVRAWWPRAPCGAQRAAAFTAWVKSATGWQVEVISGLEEGRPYPLGVVTGEPGARGRCVLILDLGGGSCVRLSTRAASARWSAWPLGAVRLQQGSFCVTTLQRSRTLRGWKQYIDRVRRLKRADRRAAVSLVIATRAQRRRCLRPALYRRGAPGGARAQAPRSRASPGSKTCASRPSASPR